MTSAHRTLCSAVGWGTIKANPLSEQAKSNEKNEIVDELAQWGVIDPVFANILFERMGCIGDE